MVAGAVSEAESRLEEKLAKALPVKLQPTLERHAERAAKDAEDQVLAKLQAAGTRGRGGLLAVLGRRRRVWEVKPLIKLMKGSGKLIKPSLVRKSTTLYYVISGTRCDALRTA